MGGFCFVFDGIQCNSWRMDDLGQRSDILTAMHFLVLFLTSISYTQHLGEVTCALRSDSWHGHLWPPSGTDMANTELGLPSDLGGGLVESLRPAVQRNEIRAGACGAKGLSLAVRPPASEAWSLKRGILFTRGHRGPRQETSNRHRSQMQAG
ncbi:uncharacterized protein BDZ99DRAFT_126174 [Mytilinidion resinicola]|uniref:Uncharacterized protein n=1 Tax=Mytilinidion resinicola TaxID=574789 RepID=A0A6A6Z472_9PEZI|nr:uncharacterized protein BDZ99DRAFT_126174 [Mytilinidion resinicola]KAF2815941.1 hypothetical protein BDZ99DRAFT_126174 [Mytilinidion resinicola]